MTRDYFNTSLETFLEVKDLSVPFPILYDFEYLENQVALWTYDGVFAIRTWYKPSRHD